MKTLVYVAKDLNFGTRENPVSAPYFRKKFTLENKPNRLLLSVATAGVYELYINGERITKGFLSPYRANPNKSVYYDEYDLLPFVKTGENVVALTVGNGFGSEETGLWDFKDFSWRSAPKFALTVESDGEVLFDATSFLTSDGEVRFDDYHSGETIDKTFEKVGWETLAFHDADWKPVIKAKPYAGEPIKCAASPILPYSTLKPVSVKKGTDCYLYDFGKSTAGTYRLKIKGKKGQKLTLIFGDAVSGGRVHTFNLTCSDEMRKNRYLAQRDELILSGKEDVFEPRFDSKGMRFCEIQGLTDEQANTLDMEFYEMSGFFPSVNEIKTGNETLDKIQAMCLQSDRSNFYYFPTDCPQREKNGWTGDAALSAEQFLLNFDCVDSLKVWLKDILKMQKKSGELPGIIPTDTWGYDWGNGPAWDNVIFEIPYRIYIYTGDDSLLKECLPAYRKYLPFMAKKRDKEGLLHYGLGDWIPPYSSTPLAVTDTCMGKSMADVAAFAFERFGFSKDAAYAKRLSDELKTAFNKKYGGFYGDQYPTQTWLSFAIYYDMIPEEKKESFYVYLKEIIESFGRRMDVGALGNRALWRVLGEHGDVALALDMILTPEYPSFTQLLSQGATTLFEGFLFEKMTLSGLPEDTRHKDYSFNHHFFGDVSAFFYRYLAGIRVDGPKTVRLKPVFDERVSDLTATHVFHEGTLSVHLTFDGKTATYETVVPAGIHASIEAPEGYIAKCGKMQKAGKSVTVFEKIG